MLHFTTDAILLKRTNYAEADRIISFLTRDKGQVQAIAKGVRKPKSKLAGGLELLSISKVTFMQRVSSGSDLHIVRSARLEEHFGRIIEDYEHMQAAYSMIATMHTVTRDLAEPDAFKLLETGLRSLNTPNIDLAVTRAWFALHALKMIGQQPSLETDVDGAELQQDTSYVFDAQQGGFAQTKGGQFSSEHIKALRLLLKTTPAVTTKVGGLAERCKDIQPELHAMLERIVVLGA